MSDRKCELCGDSGFIVTNASYTSPCGEQEQCPLCHYRHEINRFNEVGRTAEAEITRLKEEVERLNKARRFETQSQEYTLVAMITAYIAGKTEGLDQMLEWIESYLDGPDLIPTKEELAMGAQAFSNKNARFPGYECTE